MTRFEALNRVIVAHAGITRVKAEAVPLAETETEAIDRALAALLEVFHSLHEAPGVTCRRCNDRHRIKHVDYDGKMTWTMCHVCPAPCQRCGVGGYCRTTPCTCECHRAVQCASA